MSRVCVQVSKLEANMEQLQLTMASAHQKHKTEAVRLTEQVRLLEAGLDEAKKYSKTLEQQLIKKDEALGLSEIQLQATQSDLLARSHEVHGYLLHVPNTECHVS
jgi:ribosomal protein L7/L12